MTLVHEQLLKVMRTIGPIAKSRDMAQDGGFKFRGIDEFLDAAHPAFIEHEVMVTPEVIETERVFHDRRDRQGNVFGFWTHVFVRVKFTFEAVDGSQRVAVTAGEGLDLSDKATNKAMSGALKYALVQALTIPVHGALDEQDADQRTNDWSDDLPREQPTRQRQNGRQRTQTARRGNQRTDAPAAPTEPAAEPVSDAAPAAVRTALADAIAGAPDAVQLEMKAWCIENGVRLRNKACTIAQVEAAELELRRLVAAHA